MNPPSPSLARDEFVRRHLRFNLVAFLIDATGWWLGMSFLSAQTLLPFFVKRLGGGEILIGLIPAINSLGYLLPQLFVAPMTERRPIQRRSVLRLAWLERLPIGLLALFTLLFGRSSPHLLLGLFFLCVAVNAVSMGCNMPGYATMLTKAIPIDKRGRIWGTSVGLGGLLGLGGAAMSAQLLHRYGMPDGFALCFLIAFVVLIASVSPLGMVREPETTDAPHHPTFAAYWAETRDLFGRYPDFGRLITMEWLVSAAGMAPAFYTVYAMERFHAGSLDVGRFNMTLIAASVVGGFLWGGVSDRRGNRRSLIGSVAFGAVAPLVALLAPTSALYPAAFFASAMAGSGFDLGMFNIVLEFAGERKVATFQGMRSLLVAPARVLFPLIGGLIVRFAGYDALFWTASIASLVALALLRTVRDPRHAPLPDASVPAAAGEPALPVELKG